MLSWVYVVVQGVVVEITGSGRPVGTRTLPGMPTRRSPLDQRSLLPNKYLTKPEVFGSERHPELVVPVVPDGGDQKSQEVALVQHRLVDRVRQRNDRTLAAVVTAKFGFSLSSWSRCLHGKAWMGETMQAAAVGALLDILLALEDDPPNVP